MALPIDYERMVSTSDKESEHFVAMGRPVLPLRSVTNFFEHLMEFDAAYQEQVLALEPVEWNKQTCYTYQQRVAITLPETPRHLKKKYKLHPKSLYFLKEFGFIDVIKPECGNKDCYNPYHQWVPQREILGEEHAPHFSNLKQLRTQVLRGAPIGKCVCALRDLGYSGEQVSGMEPQQFLEEATKELIMRPEKYESDTQMAIKSGLMSDVIRTEQTQLEIDEDTERQLVGLRSSARDAGNIDLYVALNDLMRRKR